MTETIEDIIGKIKDSLSWTEVGYSGGCRVDRNYCPICGADEVIRYNSNQPRITMDTLEHEDDCVYTLIRKLENELISK